MAAIDPEQYQQRLDRISELFSGLVSHAETTAQHRCPYRDRHDHCTAMFTCKNQRTEPDDPGVLLCGHDGVLDYRDAWESHPRNRERMKRRIEDIRIEGQRRRAGDGEDSHSA